MIPSGTVLTIRMVDSVDSERDYVGQTFKASLDEPVLDPGGRTLVPRGADVVVKLVDDVQSGKIEGRTVLTLDIVSLRVNGREVDVDTTAITQQSGSRTARSGKVIGGTAALGAIIGAIAGGGKGAAIGAGAGAGAGTVAQVATKGQRVRIPSETRLTFTLQQPVRLEHSGYSFRWLCCTALAVESAWCECIESLVRCDECSDANAGRSYHRHLRPLSLPVFRTRAASAAGRKPCSG